MNNLHGVMQHQIKESFVYLIEKPQGTIKADYVILFGKCFASFHTGTNLLVSEVCKTSKAFPDSVKETDTHLIIEI